jgi:hypothetical protein
VRTAYLVAHIDTTQTPPTVVGVGIYSMAAHDLTCELKRKFPVDVLQAKGKDYGEAEERLRTYIHAPDSPTKWVLSFLDK